MAWGDRNLISTQIQALCHEQDRRAEDLEPKAVDARHAEAERLRTRVVAGRGEDLNVDILQRLDYPCNVFEHRELAARR